MIWLVVWTMLLAAPATGWSQETTARGDLLTLDQAVGLALQQNRTVKNAAVDVNRAKAQLQATVTQRYPTFQVGLTNAYTLTPIDLNFKEGAFGVFPGIGPVPATNTTIRQEPGFATALTARVAQPLSQLYRINLGIDQQAVSRDLAAVALRLQHQTVVSSVKTAYYQVLESQSALEALEETIRSYRELQRVVEDQLRERAALRVDLLEVQQGLANAELSALTTRHDQIGRAHV